MIHKCRPRLLIFTPFAAKLSHYLPFVTYTFIFLLVFANRIMIVAVVVVVKVEFVAGAGGILIVAFRLKLFSLSMLYSCLPTIHITMATMLPVCVYAHWCLFSWNETKNGHIFCYCHALSLSISFSYEEH